MVITEPRILGKFEVANFSEPRLSGKLEGLMRQISATEKAKPDKNASLGKNPGDHYYPEFEAFEEEEK